MESRKSKQTDSEMSLNMNKVNDLSQRLQRFSDKLSKKQLSDLTFRHSIHENENIEPIAKVVKYGGYIVSCFGITSILIGILAAFYGQIYLTIFGMFSILHLFVGPLTYVTFEEGQRFMFMAICTANQLWIGIAFIYFTTYIFLKDDNSFETNIMHHFLSAIHLLIALGLQVFNGLLAFKLIKYLDQIISQLSASKT